MDAWNPIIAETYVKRVAFWRVLAGQAFFVVASVAAIWCMAVLILSLELGGL